MELIRDKIDDTTVLVFQGPYLDLSNAEVFAANVSSLVTNDRKVVFDMSRVDFVDSAGLGVLMACRRQLVAGGTSLTLCCLTKKVRNVFEVARMHRLFTIAETRAAALALLEPAP
jgi:anti-sigma B factor antagonist